ncbi:hypothetical protein LAZ67_15002973 [Cordylochernes scorpioides]|uniref:Uncharacterized protein n=1 Tax=Cordylochernes scorpioides TaxID=51811 RepID=A0ABY6L9X4_9ARAC|nr:hypothetical protein LAZ67_15002973 [Cordylochernes scorpioides]
MRNTGHEPQEYDGHRRDPGERSRADDRRQTRMDQGDHVIKESPVIERLLQDIRGPYLCTETSETLHWTQQQQQKIDMDPEQQFHTPKIENDCCDRDVWRHLTLFIGHNNNNRKLTWTQSSSFTHPR